MPGSSVCRGKCEDFPGWRKNLTLALLGEKRTGRDYGEDEGKDRKGKKDRKPYRHLLRETEAKDTIHTLEVRAVTTKRAVSAGKGGAKEGSGADLLHTVMPPNLVKV